MRKKKKKTNISKYSKFPKIWKTRENSFPPPEIYINTEKKKEN